MPPKVAKKEGEKADNLPKPLQARKGGRLGGKKKKAGARSGEFSSESRVTATPSVAKERREGY